MRWPSPTKASDEFSTAIGSVPSLVAKLFHNEDD